MNAWLEYLLKANLFLALFYGCYWLWLRKHTFFRLNRAYLIASVLASLGLPLIELPTETVETIPVPMGMISLPVTVSAVRPTGPDWEVIGYWGYGLVGLVLLIRLLMQVTGVGRLIQRSERHPMDAYTLVLPNDERIPTFSFFRYLVLCRQDAQNAHTPIVAHELVHIRQWHSLDILLLELVQLVFWFNPVLILYKRAIRQLHEFLADAQAEDKHEYATFLVNYAFGVQPQNVTNGFFKPSLLKERLRMLQRRTTSRWALGKYMLVLPLMLGLLAMTTAREQLTLNLLPTNLSGQNQVVTGQVLDADGQPLAYATLIVMGTSNGTQTDVEGSYRLYNVAADARIVASHVGFETQVKEVRGKGPIDFILPVRIEPLKELLVVGYGIQKNQTPAPAKAPRSAESPSKEEFTVIEQMPEFPGGTEALGRFLAQTIRYPAEAVRANVSGKVFVQFTVGTRGDVYSLRVIKGIGFGCDEEAVRVVSKMPAWKPARQSGQAVAVQYVLPIQFFLDGSDHPVEKASQPQPAEEQATNLAISHRFRLHGIATSNGQTGQKPLYVIDGKVQDSKEDLADLDPSNILSINVLKGTSATALYGKKAEDGAILITTKGAPPKLKTEAMQQLIQLYSQPRFDNLPTDYFLDDKAITQDEFSKLDPATLQNIEVDHRNSTSTVKAHTKK